MSVPAVSIIIPIYNVEKYLERCLSSIKKQDFCDFEVIMVDDGSSDGSGKIAQKFAEKDSRFILYTHENLGTSETRNFALRQSRGEYISFIDSDDYIAPNFISSLYYAAKNSNSDVTMCGFSIHYEQNGKIKPMKSLKAGEYSKDEAMGLLLRDKEIRFFIWNKLWRTELIKVNNITFRDMYYEDILFCTTVFNMINKLTAIDLSGYFYSRRTKTFLEQSMSDRRINDYIYTVEYLRNFLEKNSIYEKYKRSFRVHSWHVYGSIPILNIQASHSSKKKGCLKRIYQGLKTVSYYRGKKFELGKERFCGK